MLDKNRIPDAYVFIDDFRIDPQTPVPDGLQGEALGFVAAVVSNDSYRELARFVDSTRRTVGGAELHCREMIAGRGKWKAVSVHDRAAIVHRVLEAAKEVDACFVWELILDDDPGFLSAQSYFSEALRGRLPQQSVRRFGPNGESKISIATAVRNAGLEFARSQYSATDVFLVEDRGVPRDQQLSDERRASFRELGMGVTPHWDQNSAYWAGLQVADIAACVIRTVHKVKWRMRDVEQRGESWDALVLDRFTKELIDLETSLLLRDRAFRVVDLPLRKQD